MSRSVDRHLTPVVVGVVAKVVRRLPAGTDRDQLLVDAALAAWEGKSVRAAVIDSVRREWGRRFHRLVQVVSVEHAEEVAGDPGLDSRIESLALWSVVDRLPRRERAVILLRYRWGLSGRRLAAEVGLHQTRIGQLERQAIRRLREWMAPECGGKLD